MEKFRGLPRSASLQCVSRHRPITSPVQLGLAQTRLSLVFARNAIPGEICGLVMPFALIEKGRGIGVEAGVEVMNRPPAQSELFKPAAQ